MKFLFALVCLFPLAASASTTQTLTCQGRAIVAGGGGKAGRIEILATKLTEDRNDNRVELVVGWEGAKDKIIAPGVFCGAGVPDGTECSAEAFHPGNLSYVVSSHCGIGSRRGNQSFYAWSFALTLNNGRDHGRLACGNSGAIEISNCK